MSNIINTVKHKLAGSNNSTDTTIAASKSGPSKPTFSILPHPAKTNDPADLQPSGGLRNNGVMDAFNTPGPVIPNEQIKNNLPEPLSRAELEARQASLNGN